MVYNELVVELSCRKCDFSKNILLFADEDGVFSIPDKYCPRCMHILDRDLLEKKSIKEDTDGEVTEDTDETTDEHTETGTADALPPADGDMEVLEDGPHRPQNAGGKSETADGDTQRL